MEVNARLQVEHTVTEEVTGKSQSFKSKVEKHKTMNNVNQYSMWHEVKHSSNISFLYLNLFAFIKYHVKAREKKKQIKCD